MVGWVPISPGGTMDLLLKFRLVEVAVSRDGVPGVAADVNDILNESMDDDVKKSLRKITVNSWIK
jgi:hypothetical protein